MPTKRLRSIGSSLGLVIDQVLLKKVGFDVGTELELRADIETRTIVLARAGTRWPGRAAPPAARDRSLSDD